MEVGRNGRMVEAMTVAHAGKLLAVGGSLVDRRDRTYLVSVRVPHLAGRA